jgi:hypothetical protein
VAYDALLRAWGGDRGGFDPASDYIRFVEAGIEQPPSSPFREAFGGWVLGSTRFVEELRTRAGPVLADPAAPEARPLAALDPEVICNAVVSYYGLDSSALLCRYDPHLARAVAASLCRRHTEAPLRELAVRLGLSGATSVPNLTRRLEARLEHSPRLARELTAIMRQVKAQTAPLPRGRGRAARSTRNAKASPRKPGPKRRREKIRKKSDTGPLKSLTPVR